MFGFYSGVVPFSIGPDGSWDLATAKNWIRKELQTDHSLSSHDVEEIAQRFTEYDLPLTHFTQQDWINKVGSVKIGEALFVAVCTSYDQSTENVDFEDQGYCEGNDFILETLKPVEFIEHHTDKRLCDNAADAAVAGESACTPAESAHVCRSGALQCNQHADALLNLRETGDEINQLRCTEEIHTGSVPISTRGHPAPDYAAAPPRRRGGRPRKQDSDSQGCQGGVPRPRRRSGEEPKGHLWQFLARMLCDHRMRHLICWEDRSQGVFRFVDNRAVAKKWGEHKGNSKMTYEKMTRTLRHYENGFFQMRPKQRLHYQFGPKADWREMVTPSSAEE